MRFALTDEQLAIRDATRDLLARECPPEVVRAAWPEPPSGGRPGQGAGGGARADAARLERLWHELAAMGVPGIVVAEVAGGLGLDEVAAVVVCEETGYAAVPFGVVEILTVVAPALAAAGARHVPLLAAVLAGTERPVVSAPGAGALPWAEAATQRLLALGDDGVRLVAIEPGDLTPIAGVDGARRLAALAGGLVGGESLGGVDVGLAEQRAALGTAAQLVGLTRRLLEMTVAYVSERRQYGVPVGSFQAIKHQLAEVRVQLEFARPAVLGAAWALATRQADAAREVAMAKALASDTARLAARTALQCHGAIGHTVEYDLHLFVKRAWALATAWGDAAQHRATVADSLDL